jgi:DNA-directed RNA polymerase beta subunit
MVASKCHARSKGPYHVIIFILSKISKILTRQPVEGRSRNGGFRIGEVNYRINLNISDGSQFFLGTW